MKKVGFLAAALLLVSQTAFAMLPLTDGPSVRPRSMAWSGETAPLGELVAPWTVYDRKQTNKYGLRERVIVYTPYLTAAVDAQQTGKNGQKPTPEQG